MSQPLRRRVRPTFESLLKRGAKPVRRLLLTSWRDRAHYQRQPDLHHYLFWIRRQP